MQLRDDQQDLESRIIASARKHKRVIAVLPTGGGKSVIASSLIHRAIAKGSPTLILAHRNRLVEQLSGTVSRWRVPHGIISPKHPETDQLCQVGSVQTVVRRLERLREPKLIIQDECHHLIEGNMWGKIVAYWPDAHLIGFTATPQRLSGEGLGEGHGGYFQDMVLGPSAEWLTEQGHLARAHVFSLPSPFKGARLRKRAGDYDMSQAEEIAVRLKGDIVAHFNKYVPEGTAIAFCCTVEHAEAVANEFNNANIPALPLHGKSKFQAEIFGALERGEIRVLCVCELVSEGVDIPSVKAALMLRPTASLTTYLQQAGRALRKKPDGSNAIILDHAGNVLRHGLPTDHREWSLGGAKKAKRDQAPSVHTCPHCFAAMPTGARECPVCGAEQESLQRVITVEEGELVAVGGDRYKPGDAVVWRGRTWYYCTALNHSEAVLAMSKKSALNGPLIQMPRVLFGDIKPCPKPPAPSKGAGSLEDLIRIGKEKGYAAGWAHRVWAARKSKTYARA